jgi:alkylation response protein AidB-like acyl-CoA dehydrogenase
MTTVESVRALSDEVSARARETEAARSVPRDLILKLGAEGVFRMFVPRSVGGAAVDPLTACSVVEEISRADGSTGWTSMILNTTFFTSWLEPDVAREMLDTDPLLGMAGIFGPVGHAEATADGAVMLSGRFPFNSGSPHATWFCQGAMVPDSSGQPQWRFLFVPASEVEILDTWYVAGLRGTASHDVTIAGAVVPRERSASPIFETAPHDEPHFRWTFFALLGALMAGVPVGIARRALDEFVVVAGKKSRGGAGSLAAEQVTQLSVTRCESSLRAAKSFLLDTLGSAWDTATAGDRLSLEQRVAIRLAAGNAMRIGIEVVDTTFALAGGGALYDDSPLQRCWRDMHAASNHIFFSSSFQVHGGQYLLGEPTDEWRL